MAAPFREFRARATLTKGGSNEAHCKELTVMVTSLADRIATPEGTKLAARRNSVPMLGRGGKTELDSGKWTAILETISSLLLIRNTESKVNYIILL